MGCIVSCVRAVGGALGAVTSSEIRYSGESDMRNTGIMGESKGSGDLYNRDLTGFRTA